MCYELKGMIIIKYPKDLTGMKFGDWTVIKRADDRIVESGRKYKMWHCVCSCGKESDVYESNLKKGYSTSCGHTRIKYKSVEIGDMFGRLTVLSDPEYKEINGKRVKFRLCSCSCGNMKLIPEYNLKNGSTLSCGCYAKQRASEAKTTHGYSKERLYKIWIGMIQRCHNPNNPNYNRYGEKGITVCDEWLHDYVSFRNWSIENGYDETKPSVECSIDRIDFTKGYYP